MKTMHTNIPNSKPPLPVTPPETGCPWPTPESTSTQPHVDFSNIFALLLKNYREWAWLIARLHDEQKMSFRKIACFVGAPTARVRQAYEDAMQLRADLNRSVTMN